MDHSEVKYLPKVDHTPAELDGWQKLLLRAAEWLETNGHCHTGRASEPDGSGCVIHAIVVSARYAEYRDERIAMEKLVVSIPAYNHPELNSVAAWSDSTPTDEVLAKLRAVALGL